MTKYQVTFDNGKTWANCRKASVDLSQPITHRWLHYELTDGTNGLRKPNTAAEQTWRIRPAKVKQEQSA